VEDVGTRAQATIERDAPNEYVKEAVDKRNRGFDECWRLHFYFLCMLCRYVKITTILVPLTFNGVDLSSYELLKYSSILG